MRLNSLDILLVGLGKVGMTYDFNGPKGQVLTHARAINSWSKNNSTAIRVIGIDPDPETQRPFSGIFDSSEWYPNIELLDAHRSFELAVIATPIATIAQDTLNVYSKLKVDKFVVEKPAAKNMVELQKLISLPNSQTNFIVGFPRPSLESSIYLKERIKFFGNDKSWKVDINYGGSVLNILSHFLNLIEFLIEPFELETFHFDSDEHLNAIFKSKSGRLTVQTHQYSKFNDEKNQISIKGPVEINYTNSGRDISIENLEEQEELRLLGIDFQDEISQMIGNFGDRYLSWAALETESCFTPLTSSSLYETIRLAEAANVR
jgi:predicted dehydrogenase